MNRIASHSIQPRTPWGASPCQSGQEFPSTVNFSFLWFSCIPCHGFSQPQLHTARKKKRGDNKGSWSLQGAKLPQHCSRQGPCGFQLQWMLGEAICSTQDTTPTPQPVEHSILCKAGTHRHSQLLLTWFTSTVGTRDVCSTPAVHLRPAQPPDCPAR